jgi:hypothetical protein
MLWSKGIGAYWIRLSLFYQHLAVLKKKQWETVENL